MTEVVQDAVALVALAAATVALTWVHLRKGSGPLGGTFALLTLAAVGVCATGTMVAAFYLVKNVAA